MAVEKAVSIEREKPRTRCSHLEVFSLSCEDNYEKIEFALLIADDG